MEASPDTPHIAMDTAGRMTAPSAARNIDAILAELTPRAPVKGAALEIASGTGQQVARFATALPGLHWQPSDIDTERLRSITAWSAEAPNIAAPLTLNVATDGWSDPLDPMDLIVTVNLLHLISDAAAESCLAGAAKTLSPRGLLAFYGPFLRNGLATSDGDAHFHAALRAANPETGYKDVAWVTERLSDAGLATPEFCAMPSNNLMIFARKG